jgi:hypothetical protein
MASPVHSDDPAGIGVLSRRLAEMPFHLERTFNAPAVATPSSDGRCLVTGIGSSEAHARYLVWLLNRWGGPSAAFAPLSGLPTHPGGTDTRLVVFSQGLSSASRLAFDARTKFAGLTLFTSATEEGLARAGRPERAERLARLRGEGAEIASFEVENEFEILIRLIGPACGFLAARLWAGRRMGSTLPPLALSEVLELWHAATARAPLNAAEILGRAPSCGMHLVAGPNLYESGFNLVCKVVEGLFRPAPHLSELLAFAHGPFQRLAAVPEPVVVLHHANPFESDLADRLGVMAGSVNAPMVRIPLLGCPSLAPLEAEAALNPVVLRLAESASVNQRNWPGKGLDRPLYEYP